MKRLLWIMAGFLLVFTTIIAINCSRSQSVATDPRNSGDEYWFGAVDNGAIWIDVDDNCNACVAATKDKADSVCRARGFDAAAGYDPLDCWLGGEKDTYIECVACTYNN